MFDQIQHFRQLQCLMAELIVNKLIILEFVYDKTTRKMAQIFLNFELLTRDITPRYTVRKFVYFWRTISHILWLCRKYGQLLELSYLRTHCLWLQGIHTVLLGASHGLEVITSNIRTVRKNNLK